MVLCDPVNIRSSFPSPPVLQHLQDRVEVGAVLRRAHRRLAGARGHRQHGGGERAQLARDQAGLQEQLEVLRLLLPHSHPR